MLPTCFPSTPHPYKSWRLRAGSEVEESQPARRQCRGAVWRHQQTVERSCRGALRQWRGTVGRHWDSVAELPGTEAVRLGPDHRASPTLRQFDGTWPPSFTYTDGWPATTTATGSSPSPCARSPDSQALQHEGTLHAGVGAAVPSTVPEEWDPPSWAGWPTSWCPSATGSSHLSSAQCPREVRNYICERCTVVPCFGKKEGNMMLGMVFR